MLTSANVSAAQAENYYEKDDYYTQGDPDLESDTQWIGTGAQNLNLEGPVNKQQFQQLLHGQTPDGKSLHSRKIDPTKHRAATDYTFSAPKSVSIAALIQKDKRVIAAHDQAVKTALDVLETRYAQTRIRHGSGIRERVQTSNLIAATFRHETSREQDPQLHTHCVVINATQLPNGKWQSMANEAVLTNQKLLGEIYQNELAYQLRQVGYEIEPQGNGLFECKGYEKPLLDLFSTRTQQIEQYIERWETTLKETGGNPLHAKQKKQATLATRLRKKTVPREVLIEGWQTASTSSQIHLPTIPDQDPGIVPDNSLPKPLTQATQSATEGIQHAAERESVFKREKAERFALEHHLGEQSFSELQTAMTTAGLIPAKDRYTTEEAIARELATIELMKSGQGQAPAISNPMQVVQLTDTEQTLTLGQYKAILDTATSTDQFMAWQGVAGAGKTHSLNLLSQLATEQGYTVTGYAPSAQAANVLQTEAHIESTTVARLLHSQAQSQAPNTAQNELNNKAIWIVDEAGLLSAKDAHALLTKAHQNNARVLLVGDTRQLSAVEAGNPFKSLQSAGLKTAYLEESRRQKTAALKTAVVCLAAGEPTEGLQQLDRAGMIHELKTPDARHQAITHDYLSLPPEARKKTLILSGTNTERLTLTAQLRTALQDEGSLGINTFTLQSLRPRDLTSAQLKYACAYEVGDVVVPVRDYRRYGMQRREQYTVMSRDLASNRLTLQGPASNQFSFDPATCADKTTYQVQRLAISQGDQLRWTRNEAIQGVRNGQRVTVEQIDAKGTATLTTMTGDAPGETLTVDLTGQQYLDYAWVSTTYSSQGKTADQVLAAIDSTLSKEGLYVAVSRAKTNLSLYTADKAQLYQRAQRSAAKENPSDYLTLFQLVNPNAQDKKTADPARDVRSETRSEYLGDRVGERLAVSHRTAVRRDWAATAGSEPAAPRASGVTPEYVSDVRGVVAGIEERHQAEELERQAIGIGEAAEAIVSGAEQLALTATALARLDDQFDQQAQRLRSRRRSPERANVGGVAEAVFRSMDPDLLARARDLVAKDKAPKPLKQQGQQREVYQRYASRYSDFAPKECDRLVACQLMDKLLKARNGQRLTQDERVRVGRVLLEGPTSQALEKSQGREESMAYVTEVMKMAQPTVERAQQTRRSQQKSRDQGMEL